MPSTYTSLLYHVVFSTKNREPCTDQAWRERLHEYLGGAVRGIGGVPQGAGGVADHVHLLFGLKATHCLGDFMRELKGSSSIWVTRSLGEPRFHWQEGYAAFTVSASSRAAVHAYIARQEEPHRSRTFIEEFRGFLPKSEVAYDQRFLDADARRAPLPGCTRFFIGSRGVLVPRRPLATSSFASGKQEVVSFRCRPRK